MSIVNASLATWWFKYYATSANCFVLFSEDFLAFLFRFDNIVLPFDTVKPPKQTPLDSSLARLIRKPFLVPDADTRALYASPVYQQQIRLFPRRRDGITNARFITARIYLPSQRDPCVLAWSSLKALQLAVKAFRLLAAHGASLLV